MTQKACQGGFYDKISFAVFGNAHKYQSFQFWSIFCLKSGYVFFLKMPPFDYAAYARSRKNVPFQESDEKNGHF